MHFLDYPATFLLCGERRKYYQAFYSVIKYEKNCTFKTGYRNSYFIYKYLMKLSPACFLSILKETALLSRLFRYQSLSRGGGGGGEGGGGGGGGGSALIFVRTQF